MLINQINNLTKEQRLDLHIKGIPSPLISMWRTGKRRPTYAQCVSLAEVTGCSLEKLLVEVALNDATEAQKKKFDYLKKGFVLPYLLALIAMISILFSTALFSLKDTNRANLKKFEENKTLCIMSNMIFV